MPRRFILKPLQKESNRDKSSKKALPSPKFFIFLLILAKKFSFRTGHYSINKPFCQVSIPFYS
ncbi:MAG: hypothetical protein COV59_01015 [Candidatus Magasanikbacteria bacterium CG11_big_fil_rev_8_21_14_0_20_39_34]|uniref:Uncharacterized protein n=1 Tax=Candidatus Magasanikbacteria bacterium CG11_big_fil_rev_8_21_14_0_20_39_34 TaxID=1974653 RepID=A0A2H0N692_9BACT|nr:MAG: hypothetical protein COV59_01015 [Candidatus Magasanikbacteria bacterium CG11_big_fil_rev_8_21_14_0_20_39_34]